MTRIHSPEIFPGYLGDVSKIILTMIIVRENSEVGMKFTQILVKII
jgi:hypothetical protein